MLSQEVKESLKKIVQGRLLFNESMKNHTSLRIGGPAEVLVVPKDETDLVNLLLFASNESIKTTIIGAGTKLLVSDDGVRGIVIKISNCLSGLTISGCEVDVGAGYNLGKLSRYVGKIGLSGLEFAVGIPGTIGGGVVMNAGAHGFSFSDVIASVRTISFSGVRNDFSLDELGFGYRQSIFQGDELIVLSARLTLKVDDIHVISKKMDVNLKWRKENQPLDLPNVGSIFVNPTGKVAGKLIDEAGLKGYMIGDAQVSEKRCNFIVNKGNATARDVKRLISYIKERVYEKFQISLECEVRFI
ncbi:MAG: UDP-N-acetylmuramate dehydrogenase [Clostridiales bacterium]|nr:UDP-N-acetylmuramate dehydrogenase [Clostridiales bacterium]